MQVSTFLLPQLSQQLALRVPTAAEDPSGFSRLAQPSGCLETGHWVFSLPVAGRLLGKGNRLGEQRPREGQLANVRVKHGSQAFWLPGGCCHPVRPGLERCSQREETEAPGHVVISPWLPGLGAWSGAGPS